MSQEVPDPGNVVKYSDSDRPVAVTQANIASAAGGYRPRPDLIVDHAGKQLNGMLNVGFGPHLALAKRVFIMTYRDESVIG